MAVRLLEEIDQLGPRMVVVSGDLTQRARRQSVRRRPRLPRPAAPAAAGDPRQPRHPALRRARRALRPMERYRAMIEPDLNPFHLEDDLAVLGLNTTRPQRWTEGSISSAQAELIRTSFERAAPVARRVLVTHHPFVPPPHLPDATVVHGRAAALQAIARGGRRAAAGRATCTSATPRRSSVAPHVPLGAGRDRHVAPPARAAQWLQRDPARRRAIDVEPQAWTAELAVSRLAPGGGGVRRRA